MQITKDIVLNPDYILASELGSDEESIWINSTISGKDIKFLDKDNGKGFAKKLHKKVTAYFDAKEGLVIANFKAYQEIERRKHTAQQENIAQCEVKKPCNSK